MLSPTSGVSAAARGQGPGYAFLRPTTAATPAAAADTHCYCHLCAHNGPSSVTTSPGAPVPEFRYEPRSRASLEEEGGVASLDGAHARRSFPSQRRRRRDESREEVPERNGIISGGHLQSKNPSRRVDFYLGPDHCAVVGDCTPGFPREWDPCYSPLPPRWNWPTVEPCREHCACTKGVWPEWERTPLPPPPPPPPCCYSPERRPHSASHGLHQPSPEFRGHPRHRDVAHIGRAEPCWECMRDHYWRDARRPDLIAVDPVCGYNGLHRHPTALSPVHSYGYEPTHQHQRLSRQTSPERGPCNGPILGHRTFFPTEVPPAKLRGTFEKESGSCRPRCANGPLRGELEKEDRKEKEKKEEKKKEMKEEESPSGAVDKHQSEGSVREQIRMVVGNLEEVLGGLRQVHLEMREVRRRRMRWTLVSSFQALLF